MDPLQIKIEKFLNNHNILYVRKVGDVGEREKEYDQRMPMEKLGQLLYAFYGYPDRSSNQKKRIFDKYYDEVFGDKNFNIEDAHIISKRYEEIKNLYLATDYEEYDQKVFYAIFLSKYNTNNDENIQLIEEALKKYRKNEPLPPARKLIQKGFKDQLIEVFEEKYDKKIEIE